MIGTVDRLDTVEEGAELAVVGADGRVQKWTWTEGVMQRDGNRLPPFFFSGLLNEGKVMLGNFAPPRQGEWFRYQSRSEWRWLVIEELENSRFRTGHYRRDAFYDWRDMSQDDLFATCIRCEAPDWATPQYLDMTIRAAEENKARLASDAQTRRNRDAKNYATYARDYLNQALEAMDRR